MACLPVERLEPRRLLAEIELISVNGGIPVSADFNSKSAQATLDGPTGNLETDEDIGGYSDVNVTGGDDGIGMELSTTIFLASGGVASSGSLGPATVTFEAVPDDGEKDSGQLVDVDFGLNAQIILYQSGSSTVTCSASYDAESAGHGSLPEGAVSLAGTVPPTPPDQPANYLYQQMPEEDASLKVPMDTLIEATFTFEATNTSRANGYASLSLSASESPTLSLSAVDNAEGATSDTEFGPYLAGVPLKGNLFTATVGNDPNDSVAAVKYAIAGGPSGAATPGDDGRWTFDPGVAKLAAGPHTLTVTAYDANGNKLATSTADTIDVKDSLDFAGLQATYPGQSTSVDATKLRFIQGIDLDPSFSGLVPDIPAYYANSTAFPNVTIDGKDVPITWDDPDGPNSLGDTFTFDGYDAANLAPGSDGVDLIPNSAAGESFGELDLHAIPLPGWMAGATSKQFVAGDSGLASALSGATSGYEITLQYAPAAGINPGDDLPVTGEPSGILSVLGSLFNGLNSSLGTSLNLTVYATLPPTQATIVPTAWSVQATLFGTPIVDEDGDNQISLDDAPIQVTSDLKADTLAAPSSITVSLTNYDLRNLIDPAKTAYDLPFTLPSAGNGSKTLTIPVEWPVVSWFGLHGELDLAGDFQASLDSLSASAQLNLSLGQGGSILLNPSKSYIQLSAAAHAKLTADAKAKIVEGLPKVLAGFFAVLADQDEDQEETEVTLFAAELSGELNAKVNAQVRVDIGGTLASPTFALDGPNTWATASVGFTSTVNVAIGPEENPSDAGETPPDPDIAWTSGTFALFGNPSKANLSDPAWLSLDGPGQTGVANYATITPSNGPALDVLGPATGGPAVSPALALAPALVSAAAVEPDAVAPTSTLTLLRPLAAPPTSVSFDLNVVADHATLTPGHHFLDVVLVDPSGEEVTLDHIDLSGPSLSANANPLGYASGWKTIVATPPAGSLQDGVPSQLEFVLTDDLTGTGQRVAVALDNLFITSPSPRLGVTTPGSTLVGGKLEFVAGGASTATVRIEDTGDAPLTVQGISLAGTGFTLVGTPAGPFLLDPGDTLDIPVQPTSTSHPASATLQVATDDPDQPSYSLPLVATGTAPAQVETRLTDVSGAGTYAGTATVTATLLNDGFGLSNQTVTFALDLNGKTIPLGSVKTGSGGVAALTGVKLTGLVAGTYPGAIVASFAGNSAFVSSVGDGALTVAKAYLIVEPLGEIMIQGHPVPALGYKLAGLVAGDTLGVVTGKPTLITTATLSSPPGAYPISSGPGSLAAANYVFLFAPGTLTVSPRATPKVAVIPTLVAPTYGQSLAFTTTVAAVPGEGTPTGTVQFYLDYHPFGMPVALTGGRATSPGVATLGAGTHVVAAVYSGDGTYASVISPAITPTIARAPLRIVAGSAAKVYGRPIPRITAAGSGFVLGQSMAGLSGALYVTTTAAAASHVGTYPVVVGGLSSANYAITYVNGTLAVTPAPLTISANTQVRVYGQPDLPLTASYFGFVDGDTPASLRGQVVLATVANPFSPVGAYAIAAGGASSPDYAIAYVPGTLGVIPPPAGATPPVLDWTAEVTTLYEEVLGRAPDAAGFDLWVAALGRGMDLATVALDFWDSPEHLGLLEAGGAPRIALATALQDANAAGQVAFLLTSILPRGPFPPAQAEWGG